MKTLRGLARLRSKLGLTQKEAAKRLGCKQPWLNRIENAKAFPCDEVLAKWMKFYGTKSKRRFRATWEEMCETGLPLWDSMGIHPVIQSVDNPLFDKAMRAAELTAKAETAAELLIARNAALNVLAQKARTA